MSNDPVEALFQRAAKHRIPMASICKRAGIAESTPSRWRTERPQTIEKLVDLNSALDALIAEEVANDSAPQSAVG